MGYWRRNFTRNPKIGVGYRRTHQTAPLWKVVARAYVLQTNIVRTIHQLKAHCTQGENYPSTQGPWSIIIGLLCCCVLPVQTILGKATLPLESIELCDVDEVWAGTPPLILPHKSNHYPTNYPEPLLTSTSRPLPLGTFHRPGTSTEIQTDDTLPYQGKGGANVEVLHVGRTPNCSEVLDGCRFCFSPLFLRFLGHMVRSTCWKQFSKWCC